MFANMNVNLNPWMKIFIPVALLAQWLERAAVNRKVTGSIPVGSVFLFLLDHYSLRRFHCLRYKPGVERHCVRVVKESDLNSDGLCPRRFEPCRCRILRISMRLCFSLLTSELAKKSEPQ
jgi:hypothetical protein